MLMSRYSNVRVWLKADIQPPEIDFRFTPNNGHSSSNVRFLPDYVRLALRSGHKWVHEFESAFDPGCVKTLFRIIRTQD